MRPLSKRGGTEILQISKRGIWWWEKPKGGKTFKNKGGTQLLKLNLEIEKVRNGDVWRKISIKHILFGHLLCIPCLNGRKECFDSNVHIKDNNSLNLACKICRKISGTKGGTNFSSLGED